MSPLLPYTESVKPVKSVKAGVWQWLTIPNSAEEFCINDPVRSPLTLPVRVKRKRSTNRRSLYEPGGNRHIGKLQGFGNTYLVQFVYEEQKESKRVHDHAYQSGEGSICTPDR